jgi:hypothetical protein
MAQTDALFLLIKSLSAGEKALVRQVDGGNAGYLALFDTLARQTAYDDRKAKKRLQTLGHTVNYAYAKHYLSRHILRVLRENRETAGVERQVQEIQILMERRVFSLAEKMLEKTMATAWAEERYDSYLRLSSLQLELSQRAGGSLADGLEEIEALNVRRRQARALLANLGDYEDLYARYRPVVKRKQSARNQWDLELVNSFAHDPLLTDEAQALSVRARRMYHLCRVLVDAYTGAHDRAYEGLKRLLALYQAQPFLLADHAGDYLNDLLRQGGYQIHFRNYTDVEQTLAEIRNVREKHGLHGADLFDKYYRLRIGLALQSRDYAALQAEWTELSEGLAQYRESLPWASLSTLLFLMARLQFEQGHLRECRLLLENLLDSAEEGVREDITNLSRLLLVFVYFEQGDYDLAEAASRAARKYLQRRAQLFNFERRILRYLDGTTYIAGDSSEISALETLRTDLVGIFQDPLEANVLAFFDITAWLERRIASLRA